MLNITEVRVKKINKGNFLGYASICIDGAIIIKEIKLFQVNDNRYIIMPGQRIKEQNRIRNYAYPINEETRLEILEKISEKYDEETDEE